jgi:pSer/pThr/pTyr-binding forkhead associated (FHA) protein
MKARLVSLSVGEPGMDVELVLPIVLGRGRRAGLVVQQPLVSRQHCELFELDGKLMVRDLGSTNGTRVNQARIEVPTELQSGDLITVGSITLRVDCEPGGTISDARHGTAVVLRSELEQLIRVPEIQIPEARAPEGVDSETLKDEPSPRASAGGLSRSPR